MGWDTAGSDIQYFDFPFGTGPAVAGTAHTYSPGLNNKLPASIVKDGCFFQAGVVLCVRRVKENASTKC